MLHSQRDAEIRHQGVPIRQQDVFGLDVAMDHTVAVGVVQRIGHFAGNADGVVHRELTLTLQSCAQRLARDHGHHIVEEAVGLSRIEQRQNMGVLESRRGSDLGEKAFGAQHGAEVVVEHLDGHVARMAEVLGEIDRGHAALAELALDAVAIRDGGGKAAAGWGHCCLGMDR